MEKIRKKFPMLNNKIVYLDSGALVLKPKQVIKAINDFYTKYSISNRTSDSKLGIFINQRIEQTRLLTAQLINCDKSEIIFNSGTTEGLNYAALLLSDLLQKNDEILISKFNHSSHMIPWIELAKKKKAKIIFSDNLYNNINEKTKIIAYTQQTNNFNVKEDFKKIYKKAKLYNSIIVNDAAQAISHEEVDSKYFDIIAFSANKLFGPTGLGVLFLSSNLQKMVHAAKFGGGAVDYVKEDGNWKEKDSIIKHEPGTLHLAGIFGFYEALVFYQSLDKNKTKNYLLELSNYAYDCLIELKNIRVVSSKGDSIILLEILNSTSQDVASYLGHKDIYVRSGVFCAQYLNHVINKPLLRISLHIYNNKKDIDTLIKTLKAGGDFLDFL